MGIVAAACPVVSTVTRVCLPGEADSETAALGYFITPCIGTLVTLLSYVLLPRLVSGTTFPRMLCSLTRGTRKPWCCDSKT